jgi:hypothetical protein
MAQRSATLPRCKVLWRNVTLRCAKEAVVAPSNLALLHINQSCASATFFGAT